MVLMILKLRTQTPLLLRLSLQGRLESMCRFTPLTTGSMLDSGRRELKWNSPRLTWFLSLGPWEWHRVSCRLLALCSDVVALMLAVVIYGAVVLTQLVGNVCLQWSVRWSFPLLLRCRTSRLCSLLR